MNNLINKDNKEIKTRISAVIITFNEEKNIRRCLESIQDIVDEVILQIKHKKFVKNLMLSLFNINGKVTVKLKTMLMN